MERAFGVVIGLGATYLFLSVVVLAIVEAIASLLALRAKTLRACLADVLSAGASPEAGAKAATEASKLVSLYQRVTSNPLLATLGAATGRAGRLPSYIPGPLFVSAFLDSLGALRGEGKELEDAYKAALEGLPERDRDFVKGIIGPTITSIEDAKRRVAEWFDAIMHQLSEAYRRNIQWITRGFAVVVVLAVNANTLVIGATFWRDSVAREAAVRLADRALQLCSDAPAPAGTAAAVTPTAPTTTAPTTTTPTTPSPGQRVCWELLEETASNVPLPLGWTTKAWHELWESPASFLTALLGLVLSIIAVCLGAPFWFDMLRRVTSLAVRPPAGSAAPPAPPATPPA